MPNLTLCPTPTLAVGLPADWGQRFVNKTTFFQNGTYSSLEEEISNPNISHPRRLRFACFHYLPLGGCTSLPRMRKKKKRTMAIRKEECTCTMKAKENKDLDLEGFSSHHALFTKMTLNYLGSTKTTLNIQFFSIRSKEKP